MSGNKINVYYINNKHIDDPFDSHPNDIFIGRITYKGLDAYLYLDDAGQQYFIRYLKDGYLKEEGFGSYYHVTLTDIVEMLDYDVFNTKEDYEDYDSEWNIIGDEWYYGI